MSTAGKPTPGPWSFDAALEMLRAYVAAAANDSIDGIARAFDFPTARHLADARLIAAAPELLEALRQCKYGAEYPDELGDIIDAAIAKATSPSAPHSEST